MKKILFLTILIIVVIYCVNSLQYIHDLLQKRELITSAKNSLEKEKKENQALHKELQVVNNPLFVEQEARNKLFMIKPGENNIFIDKDAFATASSRPFSTPMKPNWLKWWEIFF